MCVGDRASFVTTQPQVDTALPVVTGILVATTICDDQAPVGEWSNGSEWGLLDLQGDLLDAICEYGARVALTAEYACFLSTLAMTCSPLRALFAPKLAGLQRVVVCVRGAPIRSHHSLNLDQQLVSQRAIDAERAIVRARLLSHEPRDEATRNAGRGSDRTSPPVRAPSVRKFQQATSDLT